MAPSQNLGVEQVQPDDLVHRPGQISRIECKVQSDGRGRSPGHAGLRICFVVGDVSLSGTKREIETASLRLANLLHAAGHEVTVLQTTAASDDTPVTLLGATIKVVSLPDGSIPLYSLSAPLSISYRVYEWFRANDEFDIVHFADRGGAGYYSICGQRQGLILQGTVTTLGLHAPSGYSRAARGMMVWHPSELEVDFIERRAAELADVVWSASSHVLEWVRSQGWNIPKSVSLRPYGSRFSETSCDVSITVEPIREIVFIGTPKSPRSLLLFLESIELLAKELGPELSQRILITIPGTFSATGAASLHAVKFRLTDVPFLSQLPGEWDIENSVEYLRQPGRLAVIVSLTQAPWNVVLDCLSHNLPFLVADVQGISELIEPESRDGILFQAKASALREKLALAIRGEHPRAYPAFDLAINNANWMEWHAQLAGQIERKPGNTAKKPAHLTHLTTLPQLEPATDATPTISLCITHYNRVPYLRQALKSIVAQTLAPHEVIVVDDGSPAGVQNDLDSIEREFEFTARGWKLIRQQNRYLGAARNRATAEASGDYILFMDDDNVAKPNEVATFREVASHDSADVYTCLLDSFEGENDPSASPSANLRWLYPGAVQSLSVLRNTFGDANALFRRQALLAVGGFTEDYGVGHEDWEVFERLMLAGYRIEVIPESLFYYRTSATSMVRSSSVWRNHLRSLRPHLEMMPDPYRTLIELMAGQGVMNWVVSSRRKMDVLWSDGTPIEGDDDESPVLHGDLPLRYRIADLINAQIKRARPIHGLVKTIVRFSHSHIRIFLEAVSRRRPTTIVKNAGMHKESDRTLVPHASQRRGTHAPVRPSGFVSSHAPTPAGTESL